MDIETEIRTTRSGKAFNLIVVPDASNSDEELEDGCIEDFGDENLDTVDEEEPNDENTD
ncbi:hypothetical protein Ciccas_010006, partial [Cichlidogyrus casuarinus]